MKSTTKGKTIIFNLIEINMIYFIKTSIDSKSADMKLNLRIVEI